MSTINTPAKREAFVAALAEKLAKELPFHQFEYHFNNRFGQDAFVIWSPELNMATKVFRDSNLTPETVFAYMEGYSSGDRQGRRNGASDATAELRKSMFSLMGLEIRDDGTVVVAED